MRTPLLPVLIGATLVIAGCAAPAPADSAGPSDDPSPTTTQPVDISPYVSCEDSGYLDAILGTFDGTYQPAPQADYYPLYLPLPSCLFENTEQGAIVSIFIGAGETDFETIGAAVVDSQGPGEADTSLDGVLGGEVWPDGNVQSLYLMAADDVIGETYITTTNGIANQTPGG
ncbi:MAG TPA: hypothetical protein VNR36_01850 [Pseudolysinimonas sp.]|nr:hypothetical protein [Pseudolysinimonas sp.]